MWDRFKCARWLSLFLFSLFSSGSLLLLCFRSRKNAVTLYSVVPFLLLYLPEQLSYLCKSPKTLSVFLSLISSVSLSHMNCIPTHGLQRERGTAKFPVGYSLFMMIQMLFLQYVKSSQSYGNITCVGVSYNFQCNVWKLYMLNMFKHILILLLQTKGQV